MPSGHVRAFVVVVVFAIGLVFVRIPTAVIAQAEHRPGTAIHYRVEQLAHAGRNLGARFTGSQLAFLEKLNRADTAHLGRLDYVVIPSVWHDDELQYSPFALSYPAASRLPKLLVIDQAAQAFAAYEQGRLLRWGPVSSGRRAYPTPSGVFHLNWRSRGRRSTVNPQWYMEWYFNFDTARGLALHSYTLPGYPASHACVRLLERDAIWIYEWGRGRTIDQRGRILEPGTPLLIMGQYNFHAPPPWRALERLSHGIDLPETPLPDDVEHSLMKQTIRGDEPDVAQQPPSRREIEGTPFSVSEASARLLDEQGAGRPIPNGLAIGRVHMTPIPDQRRPPGISRGADGALIADA